jgi:hypothetical protein
MVGASMEEFWVCVTGELTEDQGATLEDAGIAVDDLRRISAGFQGAEWQTLRTCVRVSARDDSAAKGEVARVLSLEATDLTAYSADVFR